MEKIGESHMFDMMAFAAKLHKVVVLEEGDRVLQEALVNPPKPRTPEFAKVVDVLASFFAGKSSRQDAAINFLLTHPVFCTTTVIKQWLPATQKKDHPLTEQRLGDLPTKVATHYQNVLLGDPANGGKMTEEQVGAAHNLLTLAEFYYPDRSEERANVFAQLRETLSLRFSLDGGFLKRTDWALYKQGKSDQVLPTPTIQDRPSPSQVMADKMKSALASAVEETPEEAAAMMNAAVAQLGTLSPVDLNVVKNGDAKVPLPGANGHQHLTFDVAQQLAR